MKFQRLGDAWTRIAACSESQPHSPANETNEKLKNLWNVDSVRIPPEIKIVSILNSINHLRLLSAQGKTQIKFSIFESESSNSFSSWKFFTSRFRTPPKRSSINYLVRGTDVCFRAYQQRHVFWRNIFSFPHFDSSNDWHVWQMWHWVLWQKGWLGLVLMQ